MRNLRQVYVADSLAILEINRVRASVRGVTVTVLQNKTYGIQEREIIASERSFSY